jgi:TonB-linked SusC/RagA family outer membrane protein
MSQHKSNCIEKTKNKAVNKVMWRFFVSVLIAFCSVVQLSAQNTTVRGKVVDEKGDAIIGANVTIKGTTTGTITDIDGNFQLKASTGTSLKVTYIGYNEIELKVIENKPIVVTMTENAKALGEVVVVGYGEQKKVSVVGAISTTSNKELTKSFDGSLGSALVGKLNGVTAVQESGIPGGETPRINIRGISTLNDASPLVIVDGVERTGGGKMGAAGRADQTLGNVSGWESINPNDVESISVLKDASATAVYGVKGANGVIIITTKRGKTGKPVVSYSFNMAVSQPTKLKNPLNAYETMLYANEANFNDGKAPMKTIDVMNNYRYHTNDFLYPDLNMNEFMLRDYAPKSSHNVNISGGTDNVKYFCSLGYFDESGLIKNNPAYGFNPNNEYRRMNVLTNLDFQFTKRFSVSMNIDTRSEQRQGSANQGNNMFWTYMYMSVPWISPGFDSEGHMIISNTPTSANGYPIFIGVQNGGMYHREQITANTVFSAKYLLDQITKGLSLNARYAFDSYSESWYTLTRGYARVDVARDAVTGEPILMKSGSDTEQTRNAQGPSKRKKYYLEASINYTRTFGKHSVTGLALYNQEKRHYFEGTYPDVPVAYMGFVSRLTYDYDNRYLAEFNLGINGSENFPIGKRFGKFPAFSLGWVASNESFLKDIKPVSFLKLRASYGVVGSDRIGGNRFLYIPGNYVDYPNVYRGYFGEKNIFSGGSGGIVPVQEGTAANQTVTWETARKLNLGLDGRFFNEQLNLSVDLFNENRDNILTRMETLPGYLFPTFPSIGGGDEIPSVKTYLTPVNYAKVNNRGIEVELGWSNKPGRKFGYFAKLAVSYSQNKATLLSESRKEYPWQYNQGLPLQVSRGLIADGYWDSYAEINNPNNPYNTYAPFPIPGDIKYKDVNGDMKIDDKDMVPFEHSTQTPRTGFTGNFGVSYKGFEFSVLIQGVTGMIYMPSGFSQRLGEGGDKVVFDYIADRWTPYNRDANYPVLHTLAELSRTSSNFQNSTYWKYDDTYARIKNCQIAYNLPSKFTKMIFVNNIRLALNGQNLFTWVKDKRMNNYDPEAYSGGGGYESYYPIMKLYGFSMNITF